MNFIKHLWLAYGKTLCSFGAIQAMQMALPLLALPWLARVLGPEAFGLLMYMCLLPPLVALFVDWGLTLGGARAAAHLRGDLAGLRALLGAAFSSKIILLAVCTVLSLSLYPLLPYASSYPKAYFWAIMAGIMRGLNPAWFFQGAGYGMPRMAAFEVSASGLALILVFFIVDSPQKWPCYLLLIASAKIIGYGWLMGGLWLKYRPSLNIQAGLALLNQTRSLFGSAFSLMACYNGSQLVLGWFLAPAALGILGAVNKMLRALASVALPFSQTIFPEICILQKQNRQKAKRVLAYSFIFTFLGASVCAGLAWVLAPWLMLVALGPDYAQAVNIFRIIIMAAPLMCVNNVLASQGLIAQGRERTALCIQAICAVASLPLAAILGCLFGIYGGTSLPGLMELTMLAGFIWALRGDFFTRASKHLQK